MSSTASKKVTLFHRLLQQLIASTCAFSVTMNAVPQALAAEADAPETQVTSETAAQAKRQKRQPRGFSISVDGVTVSKTPDVNYVAPVETTANAASDIVNEQPQTQEAVRVAASSQSRAASNPAVDPIETSSLPVPSVKPATVDAQQISTSLEDIAIDVTYDSGNLTPELSVSVKSVDEQTGAFSIVTRSNYPAFVERAELVLLSARRADGKRQELAVVPVGLNQSHQWVAPDERFKDSYFALRVYDQHGRFDQTMPAPLSAGIKSDAGKSEQQQRIQLTGGMVTIAGRDLPAGAQVGALGEWVGVSGDTFKIKRILPPGDHVVDVKVKSEDGQTLSFGRDINIATNDWFYVAMADFTLGQRHEHLVIADASDEAFAEVYTKGRLSFYLKGKIRGKYLITASADTQDGDLKNMFRRLTEKDAQSTLQRIDPDAYYPVYGDGSESIDDAPTSGNFYVRIERGDSHVMWGDYKTTISGTRLLQHNRTLYGAHGKLATKATTKKGEHRASVEAYAAQPDTLSQREQFLGTGGSIYVLNRQDIVAGSETVSILVKDELTGRIISTRELKVGEDYDLNTIQGILTLSKPLARRAGQGSLLLGAAGDELVSIVDIQYDYTPISTEVEGYAGGGRAETWLTERVRLGTTGHLDQTGEMDKTAWGVDARVELGNKSWIEVEYAASEGRGTDTLVSTDGGFTSSLVVSSSDDDIAGESYALRGELDLSDLRKGVPGKIAGFAEKTSAGFSADARLIDVDQTVWGVLTELDVRDGVTAKAEYEQFQDADGKRQEEIEASVAVDITEKTTVEIGALHLRQSNPASVSGNGSRTDVGGKLAYAFTEDTQLYVFGQHAVDESGTVKRNDRIGVGGKHKLGLRLSLHGEVYSSTAGLGGEAGVTYEREKGREVYLTYVHDAEAGRGVTPSDTRGQGTFVVGAKHKYTDDLSTHLETGYRFGDADQTVSYAQGVTYAPGDNWTFTGQVETAKDEDEPDEIFERKAFSVSVDYKDGEDFSAKVRSELRFDDSTDLQRQRDTYMLLGGISYRVSDDWVLQADAQAIHSITDQTSILNGEYYEANLGFAYRPVDNDRFNGLFRYRFLYDLPAVDQVDFSGKTFAPAQHSHILSADGTLQLNPWLSVGGKYGFRYGEASATRLEQDFTSSTAHLGIVRADLRLVKKWDALVEARVLHLLEADQQHYGSLAAVYRHIGDNVKLGVGYNFGVFSDDLADLTLNDRGSFVNVVGKF